MPGGRTFNGSSQYGNMGAAAGLELTTFTIAGWIKNGVPSGAAFCWEALNGSYAGWRFAQKLSVSARYALYDGTAWRYSDTDFPASSAWKHFAVRVASASAGAFFIDGVADGTFTPGTIATAGGTDKLVMVTRDNEYAQGEISEWAIWNIALSDGAITSLAGGTNPADIGAGNQVSYWPFDETGSTITDQWGSNDITLTGSPGVSSDGPPVDPPGSGGGGIPIFLSSYRRSKM